MDKIYLLARLKGAAFPDGYNVTPCQVQTSGAASVLWWTPDQRLQIGGSSLADKRDLRVVDLSSQFALLTVPDEARILFPVDVSAGEAKRTLFGPHRVCLFQLDNDLRAVVLRSQLWAVQTRLGLRPAR
ncbi:MAG: hypothetical protein AAF311_04300 [Pseudomonadota bacterium]